MSNSKFLKAHCKEKDRWYGLEIKNFGYSWKVVNMVDLSKDEAAVVSSEINQDSFSTNTNLIPCTKCGNRKVGGCSCARKIHQCSTTMKYQFNCIYCDKFEIDYTIPSASGLGAKDGETITLSQGQEIRIKYADNRPLSKIFVGVGWNPAAFGSNIDVDSSVVVASGNSDEYELIYYGKKEHPSGCVVHHGDNLTGIDIPNADDENISVYLDKVPSSRDKLIFILNIYKSSERNQTFGGIENLYIKIYDPDSHKTMVEYKVKGNYVHDTGLIIGMAYKKKSEWFFKAIGKGMRVDTVEQLAKKSITNT